MANIAFQEGTLEEYNKGAQDEHILYKVDNQDVYLGKILLSQNIDEDEYALKKYYGDTQINVGRQEGSTEGAYSTAEGYQTTASGKYSHAEGYTCVAQGDGSHAEGYSTASGAYSHAEIWSQASGAYDHSEGYSIASGDYCDHSEGYGTTASGGYGAHAEGYYTTASNYCDHTEGGSTESSGGYAHAEGLYGMASGMCSHVEGGYDTAGERSVASGYGAHAEGSSTQALSYANHAEGLMTVAGGYGANHAEGYLTTASLGSGSNYRGAHAEGWGTVANNTYAPHAEGYSTTATGTYGSHAEGSSTTASGDYGSHAEGCSTTASGHYGSHAEGYYTTASGLSGSHAEGYYTTARDFASHAQGAYNKDMTGNSNTFSTSNTAMVIGNGTASAKSNAFRVTFAGAVYALSAFNSSGADYAEFIKEWADGNPDNEDRVGYFVTVKDDGLVKANDGDYIVGIVSGCPSVVGNSDEDYYWKYQRDEFGRVIFEEVEEEVEILVPDEVESESDEKDDMLSQDDIEVFSEKNPIEDDNPLGAPGLPVDNTSGQAWLKEHGTSEEDETANITYHTEMVKTGNTIENGAMVLATDYDSSLQTDYIERKDRPEWDYVGMIGALHVRDDGTCRVGGLCKCGQDGIATAATEMGFFTYLVIERVTDNVIIIILK